MPGSPDLSQFVRTPAADHRCDRFARVPGVDGHPEVEMTLVELYRATGQRRYLAQARRFVGRRGRRVGAVKRSQRRRGDYSVLADIELGRGYFQDDVPVREAVGFSGHAVRRSTWPAGRWTWRWRPATTRCWRRWCGKWEQTAAARTAGWLRLTRSWRPGDRVRPELPVAPRWTWPDPRIDALRGQVAVERGPLVYCAESVGGHDPPLDRIEVAAAAPPVERPADELAPGAVALAVPAGQVPDPGAGWPYRPDAPLRRPVRSAEAEPLVPYHLWGNRGPATMRVWLPPATRGG